MAFVAVSEPFRPERRNEYTTFGDRVMERTPNDTPVGVDDPYEHVELCDHLADDGRCRYAFGRAEGDPEFARRRREEGFRCPAADPEGKWSWRDCPHFRSRADNRECARCGDRRASNGPR